MDARWPNADGAGYAAEGEFAGSVADTEQFARQLIESTLDDLRVTTTGQIARAILALLGIN